MPLLPPAECSVARIGSMRVDPTGLETRALPDRGPTARGAGESGAGGMLAALETISSNWPNRFYNAALPLLDAPRENARPRRGRLRKPRSAASARHPSPSCRIARSSRRSPSLVGSAYRLMLRPAGAVTEPHRASRTIGHTPARPRDFSSLSASPKQGGYRHRTRGSEKRGGRSPGRGASVNRSVGGRW